MKSYSLTETAKLIREALKTAYPTTKFSVRSKSYSGGCSIDASWTDGPREKQVKQILAAFEQCGFDGMTDCKTYHPHSIYRGEECTFRGNFVFGTRHISFEAMKEAAFKMAFECDLPLLEVTRSKYDGSGYIDHGAKDSGQVPWSIHLDYDTGEPTICWDPTGGEWYGQLVHRLAHSTSYAEARPVDLPEWIDPKLIDATLERMAIQ